MNEIMTTAASDRGRGRLSRRLRQLVIGVAVAACALMLGAGAASASQSTYRWGVFDPQTGYPADCWMASGPVWDPYYDPSTSPSFASIGGGQLACNTVHTYQIWIQEYFSATGAAGSYYQKGTTGYYSATGHSTPGILGSGRACGTGHWFTRVTVTLSGLGTWSLPSYEHFVQATGVQPGYC